MKKLIVLSVIFFISISSSLFCFRIEAKAEEYPYARVVSEDACLYADYSLSMPRFVVPESYYVKVVTRSGDICRVSYMDGKTPPLEGYVKTINLSFVKEKPRKCYPDLILTAIRDEVMFSELGNKTPRAVLSVGDSAYFYGELSVSGENYVYVYAGGCIGYVSKSCFSSFTVPFTDGYVLPTENSSSDPSSSGKAEEKDKKSSEYDPGKIIIIAAALIAVVSVVFIVTRPQRAKSNAFYRDDD